jgi:phosphoribosylanthranilate isomerase
MQCRELKQKGIGVIKVFSIDDQMDFERTRVYSDVVDFFLFDTKGKYRGGNAETFNWSILERYHQELPFILSGGLSPENVDKVTALKDMNLHALDVNSGVEITAGLKDPEKIKQIKDTLILY